MHGDLSKKKIEKGRLLKRTSTVAQNNEKHLSRGAFFLCWTEVSLRFNIGSFLLKIMDFARRIILRVMY